MNLRIKSRLDRIGFSMLIIVIAVFISVALFNRKKLRSNHLFTVGVIVNCDYKLRSVGDIFIKYKYIVDANIYVNKVSNSDISIQDCQDNYIGKSFPIAYHPVDKTLNQLFLSWDRLVKYDESVADTFKKYFR